MKTLVVYSSQTGNTKKLASAVYESLKGEKEIFPVQNAPDPKNYDFIALGFWFKGGKPDPKSAEYLDKVGKGKRLFLFATHGASPRSDHAKNGIKNAANLAPDAELIGSFTCQGEVNPKVMEKVKAKPVPPVWINDAPDAAGHPDDGDINRIKEVINNLV